MPVLSVLYPIEHPPPAEPAGQPASFDDLNLDQVVQAVTASRASYDLAGYFYTPLHAAATVGYRHDVVRDLQRPDVRAYIDAFATGMNTAHAHLATAASMRYLEQRQRWVLDAADAYCATVTAFAQTLPRSGIASVGLRAIAAFLTRYVADTAFTTLAGDVRQLRDDLAEVRYTLQIYGDKVTVTRYDGEPDYSADILDTFARFQRHAARDHHSRFESHADMDHVAANILSCVAKLYPDTFARLAAFARDHGSFINATVARFDREVQFYLAYLDHIAALTANGLTFCFPRLVNDKHIDVADTFDLALAAKLVHDRQPVIRNDIVLRDTERIAVVTGANQGGKTTFARTFGQLHYLTSLGLPVPGIRARLPLCDVVYTHFEKQERLDDLRGKLEDDLVRIHEILAHATGSSVVILNEVFTSTTAADAELLGQRIISQLMDLDAVGVYVTFIDDLATLGPAIVSMVATVDPEDPGRRTFTVRRQAADGNAHAETLAEHYGLSYDRLRKRVTS